MRRPPSNTSPPRWWTRWTFFLKHQKKFPQFNAPRFIEDFAACLRR